MGSRKAQAPRRWAWVAGLTFVALLAVPVGTSAAVEVGSGDDVLIFVAHPDDDIILAAGVAMDQVGSGGNVTVAFLTNGDRCESQSQVDAGFCSALDPDIGTVRQLEAVAGQIELGVAASQSGSGDNNLIFLGYPNGYVDKVRYGDTGGFPVLANTQTYASRGLSDTDWHDHRTAGDSHAAYPSATMSADMLEDVEALIATYKPDQIFTHSRWDRHQDHRTTYFTLIDAIKLVQDSDPSYDPYIHTGIVHVPDYPDCVPVNNGDCDWNLWPASPNPSTPVNEYDDLERDTDNELVWDQRESFEVRASMQTGYFSGTNEKANAIEAHASQVADGAFFIRRFAHSDEVFWVEKLGDPEGQPDAYTVTEGGSISQGGSGVLSNDVRGIGTPAGAAPGQDRAPLGPMAAELVSGPSHAASFSLDASGSFSYTHNGAEAPADSFTYRPAQGSANGSVTTVTISVDPVNDAPTAVADSYEVAKGATLNVAADGVLGNDSDPEDDSLAAVEVSGVVNGSLSLNSDGSFTYVHDGSATSSDSFAYKANDGQHNSNTVTVSLTITDTIADLVAEVAGPATGAATQGHTFTADVTGGQGTRSYSWRALFGGTPVATSTDPSLTFSDDDAGTYVIELTVTDSTGSVVDSQDFKLLGDIAGSPFLGDIIWLADEGITKGCNPPVNDMFCPDDRVTRGQMAAFLVRFLDLTAVEPAISFDDIAGSVFETNVLKLATAGITRGCNPAEGNTSFCPNDFVTRGQMAAFLVRAFVLTDNGGGDLFTDDDGTIFESNIDKLATAGITRGCNAAGDEFCPNSFVTRGQMAAFLHRADGL